jgi:hypothetical protein
VYRCGNPLCKSLRQTDLGPLPARPSRAFCDAFLKRRKRKIQQDDKRRLIFEQIISDMRRRIITRRDFVQGKNGTQVQVSLLPKLTSNFVHVPIQLLEKMLQPLKERVQSRLIAREIGSNKGLEHLAIAVFGPPMGGNLL